MVLEGLTCYTDIFPVNDSMENGGAGDHDQGSDEAESSSDEVRCYNTLNIKMTNVGNIIFTSKGDRSRNEGHDCAICKIRWST